MSIRIRAACSQDLEALQRLMSDLVGHEVAPTTVLERLDMLRERPGEMLFVCETDGKVAGAFGFRLRENLEDSSRYGEVSLLVTGRESRRRGLGRVMLDYAEGLARENDCIGTWLVSGFGREEEAHQFYARKGYRITGYRFVKPLDAPPEAPAPARGFYADPTFS